MKNRRRLALSLLLLASFARAEEPLKLPPFPVEETRPGVADTARELSTIPGGVGLVDLGDQRDGRLTNVNDFFALQPGVIAMSAFGGIDHPRVSIRGSSLHRGQGPMGGRGILYLQDGFAVNFADGSFDFYEFLDPLSLCHATIARGGNALRFGNTTLGGAVDMISPTGQRAPALQVRVEAGSDAYLRGQVITARKGQGWDVLANFAQYSSEGWRDFNRQEAQRFNTNIGQSLGGTLFNRVYLSAIHSRVEVTGVQSLSEIKRRASSALAFTRMADIERETWQWRVADRLSGSTATGKWTLGAFLSGVDMVFTRRDISDESNLDYGLDGDYTLRGELSGLANSLRAAFRIHQGVRDAELWLSGTGMPPGLTAKKTLLFADNRLTATNLTASLEDHLSLAQGLELVSSVAATSAERKNGDRFSGRLPAQDSSSRQRQGAVLGQVGLLWGASEATQFFASVSRSWEPPTWDAILSTVDGVPVAGQLVGTANPRRVSSRFVAAQSAYTVEAGTRGRRGAGSWDLTVFRSWVRNEMLLQPGASVGSTVFTNADKTLHQGVETAASWDFLNGGTGKGRKLVARLSHTYSDFRYDGDPLRGDRRLPVVPENYFQGSLHFHDTSGFHAGALLTWVPRGAWVDYANTFRAPGYALVDLNAGYRFGAGWRLFVEVRNVFDRVYVSGMDGGAAVVINGDPSNLFPGTPRSYLAGVEWKW